MSSVGASREPAGASKHPPAPDDLEGIELSLLLEGVFRQYGFDFREYAPASLRRRVWRRVFSEGLQTISALQDKLLHDPACMERLLLDLSINVTAMFRDPSFYVAFREKVSPRPPHVSVHPDLGRRLLDRRGGLLARDPAPGGAALRPRTHLCD